MIPGKQYTPEVLLQILWRRKWLVVVPAVVIATSVAVWVRRLPNIYEADTTILVVPQPVPEDYVRPAVSTSIDDRLTAISHQILSRSRLERIVQDFNLYPELRRTQLMEDIVNRMRNSDVTVEVLESNTFRVGYQSSDPRTAMKVAERLAGLFIDENLKDRERLAMGTNQFLESQVEEARRQLRDNERKLEDYRRRHSGELPTDIEANLEGIHNVEMQLQALADSIARDRDRRLILERSIADGNALEASTQTPASSGDSDSGTASAADQLHAAQAALQEMQLRLKPEHPDIGIQKRLIAQLEKRAEAEAADAPVSEPNASEVLRRNRLNEAKAELANLDKSLATKLEGEQQLRAERARYQRQLEAAPTRETELTDLTRDYNTFQSVYQGLLSKREESRVTANLERRQIGERFRILDAPQLPERPSSPNRPRMYLMGLAAAFAVGLGLAALMEYRDRTMRSEEDVKAALNVLVLATVPMVLNPEVVRRRRHLLAVSVSVMVAVIGSAAFMAWRFLR